MVPLALRTEYLSVILTAAALTVLPPCSDHTYGAISLTWRSSYNMKVVN